MVLDRRDLRLARQEEEQGRDTPVVLTDVPVNDRAPIIRKYLELAPGARPHIPVDRRAPVADFEGIAADYPVFRIGVGGRRGVPGPG